MRLSEFEIDTIKNTAREIWGEQATVYLFGSRIDDSEKGGDIDLYIHLDEEPDTKSLMIQKASFLAMLEILLGEQKIDLLINTSYNTHLPIIKSAAEKGLAL
jgi:predicted nucleotidyltransferase